MTITLSDDLAERLKGRAREAGVSVEALLKGLLEDDWEQAAGPGDREDESELEEIRAAIDEGLEQMRRGEGRPAEIVFADLRARHGIPD